MFDRVGRGIPFDAVVVQDHDSFDDGLLVGVFLMGLAWIIVDLVRAALG